MGSGRDDCDLLRRELCRHFGQDPAIADGIFLRTWKGGDRKGEPKIPPPVQTMLDRGLVMIRPARTGVCDSRKRSGVEPGF